VGELLFLVTDARFDPDAAWVVRSALRAARRRSGLSADAFSAALGVSVDLLDLWEEGRAMPPSDRLVRALRLGHGRTPPATRAR
jgi:DNA-binding transcriptional regulator YiaG